ncbi:POL1 protein, partial [Crocuta crocuta]
MTRTLKETLTKLTLETGGDWVALLPFALFQVRNSPYQMGLTPFEIMYGKPAPIIPNLQAAALMDIEDSDLLQEIQAIQRSHEHVLTKLRALYESGPPPEPHQYWPGNWVYVKRHRQETLEPRWKGPYIILLTTPTTLKVDGIAAWIHYTHVRPADHFQVPEDYLNPGTQQWRLQPDKKNPLKLRLSR